MNEKTRKFNEKKDYEIKQFKKQIDEKITELEKTIDACDEIINNPKQHGMEKVQEAARDYLLADGALNGLELMANMMKNFEKKMADYYIELDSERIIKIEDKPELKLNRMDFRLLILSAFRYALGRMTYIVPVVANVIGESKDRLDSQAIDLIIKEIEEAEKRDGLGMECDIEVWLKLKKELEDFRSSRSWDF